MPLALLAIRNQGTGQPGPYLHPAPGAICPVEPPDALTLLALRFCRLLAGPIHSSLTYALAVGK